MVGREDLALEEEKHEARTHSQLAADTFIHRCLSLHQRADYLSYKNDFILSFLEHISKSETHLDELQENIRTFIDLIPDHDFSLLLKLSCDEDFQRVKSAAQIALFNLKMANSSVDVTIFDAYVAAWQVKQLRYVEEATVEEEQQLAEFKKIYAIRVQLYFDSFVDHRIREKRYLEKIHRDFAAAKNALQQAVRAAGIHQANLKILLDLQSHYEQLEQTCRQEKKILQNHYKYFQQASEECAEIDKFKKWQESVEKLDWQMRTLPTVSGSSIVIREHDENEEDKEEKKDMHVVRASRFLISPTNAEIARIQAMESVYEKKIAWQQLSKFTQVISTASSGYCMQVLALGHKTLEESDRVSAFLRQIQALTAIQPGILLPQQRKVKNLFALLQNQQASIFQAKQLLDTALANSRAPLKLSGKLSEAQAFIFYAILRLNKIDHDRIQFDASLVDKFKLDEKFILFNEWIDTLRAQPEHKQLAVDLFWLAPRQEKAKLKKLANAVQSQPAAIQQADQKEEQEEARDAMLLKELDELDLEVELDALEEAQKDQELDARLARLKKQL